MFETLIETLRKIKIGECDFNELPDAFWQSSLWSDRFYLELMKFHSSAIYKIPQNRITSEIANIAIDGDPMAIRCIPDNLKTLDLCLTAIKRDAGTFIYCPENFHTQLLVAWEDRVAGGDFDDVLRLPKYIRTHDFWVKMVRINPCIIIHLENKEHTIEICESFVKGGDVYLENIPWENRSRNLCIICLKYDHGDLDGVPQSLWDDDMIKANEQGKRLRDV